MTENEEMPLIAEARVETEDASRYLVELCEHLNQKAEAKPELGVRVAWTKGNGTVDFGWGRCAMRADEDSLSLRAEADDDDGLRQVRELISRHLQKHAGDDRLTLTWRQDGTAIADSHTGRRDTMRGFHRRMRH
jgi:uncharacterized protein